MNTIPRPRFSPSINLVRDVGRELNYYPTDNARRAYQQILNDFSVGIHSFSLIGSYGTGKSFFLVALEQTLKRTAFYFPDANIQLGGANEFGFINLVGSYSSLAQALAAGVGAASPDDIWTQLNARCRELSERNGFLLIVIDEFGKFLEYAAHVDPERELYFIQQLAEYVNAEGRNALLLVTLHQNFSAYAYSLDREQREEWEKVKGRLKELTFNEPVEQLLELAANQINGTAASWSADGLPALVKTIEASRAFPHQHKLHEEFASRLLPFDLLAASVLTQALQRYGQNERSLFTFLRANDRFGLHDFDQRYNRYFNVASVYDYLAHNYESFLVSVHNPNYAQWATLRNTLERTAVEIEDRRKDAASIVKIVGLLNIFAPQSAKTDRAFLSSYCKLTLGMTDVESVLHELETHKILRFVRYRDSYVLAEGTDLNIDHALYEAGSKVEVGRDITPLLRKLFTFPVVLAKSTSYRKGTPRFFGFHLSAQPLAAGNEDSSFDGIINLVFAEDLSHEELISASATQDPLTLTCWYRSAQQIREQLLEVAKVNYVIAANESDRVATRVLHELRTQAVERLNQSVLSGMYADDGTVLWAWQGKEQVIRGPAELNTKLSEICGVVFSSIPIFRNELINRNAVSSAVATARKALFRALVENWDKPDLGFDAEKYPPEKTIYLSLLKRTQIHRENDGQWVLDEPADVSFIDLWQRCQRFLDDARVAPRNVADLFDALRLPPFGLKQGFVEFWAPMFLFAQRETFALYREDRFQPEITADGLELLKLAPQKHQIKSFNVDGIKLRFFNRLRTAIQHKEAERITQSGFLETIKPFLVFYNALPAYARQTQRLTAPTIRLRAAIAGAKDPERTFFEDFPSALGYPNIADEHASDEELAAYIGQLQASVRELQSCYDDLVDRIEAHLLNVLGVPDAQFPGYREIIADRFASLRAYLLLARQRTFYMRLMSPLEDRAAWLGAVIQSLSGRDIKQMSDDDELAVYARLREALQELDNLCDFDSLPNQNDSGTTAIRVEITAPGRESHKIIQHLPKQKEEHVAVIQMRLREALGDDTAANATALIRLLEEITASG